MLGVYHLLLGSEGFLFGVRRVVQHCKWEWINLREDGVDI